MSQKYPEGAIITVRRGNGDIMQSKIIGCAGQMRFLEHDKYYMNTSWLKTVNELEEEGWTVVEEPWEPQEGFSFYFVATNGDAQCIQGYSIQSHSGMQSAGNCYRTREQAETAAERVKKAYK